MTLITHHLCRQVAGLYGRWPLGAGLLVTPYGTLKAPGKLSAANLPAPSLLLLPHFQPLNHDSSLTSGHLCPSCSPQAPASPTAAGRQSPLSGDAEPGTSWAPCQQHEEPTLEGTGLLCQPGSLLSQNTPFCCTFLRLGPSSSPSTLPPHLCLTNT